MNAIDRPAAARPAGRPAPPIAVAIAPAALRTLRLIAGLTVAGPFAGGLLALGLALRHGVGAPALWCLAVMLPLTALGISVGFHRLFAHRAFLTSQAMRVALLIAGSMAMQGSLLYWVATHRRHHQFSDTPDDPHSPHYAGPKQLGYWGGLWHGHIAWMFAADVANAARFCPDILRDATLFRLQKRYLLWAGLGLLLPALVGLAATGTAYGALECLLWGGAVRLLAVHHAYWAVGSLSHMHGEKRFETRDQSANNYFVAAISFGEGLQNNHHAFPASARHALRWFEPDAAGWAIGLAERLGLVWDVKHPSPEQIANKLLRA